MATKQKLASPPKKTTIFDDVYRTIVQKLSFLLIPAINEVFGTHYDMHTSLTPSYATNTWSWLEKSSPTPYSA